MKFTIFTRCLQPILILSLVCGFALTATAQDYYPTTIGNTWGLLSTDEAERLTYSIEEIENGTVEGVFLLKIVTETLGTETVDIDKYYISDENGNLLLHATATDEGTFGIAESTLDPPATFFPAELPLGRTWQVVTVAELNLVGTSTTTSTIKVVSIEDVVTPAGTFADCVKIEINRQSVTALLTVRSTYYQWLAPDVGPIKYENDQGIVFELESYNLVDATDDSTTDADTDDSSVTDDTTDDDTTTSEPTDDGTTDDDTTTGEPTDDGTTDDDTTTGEPTDDGTTDDDDTTTDEPTSDDGTDDTGTTEDDMPEDTPTEPTEYSFDITLAPGLNMISIPLMPAEPYTAKALAEMLGSTIVIKLDASTQRFVGYTIAEDDDGFAIDGGSGYIINSSAGRVVPFTGKAWTDASAAPKISTAKSAWAFVITTDLQRKQTGVAYTVIAKNLRTGAVTTQNVTPEDARVSAVWANLNYKSVAKAGDTIEIKLLDERGTLVSGPFQRTIQTSDIHNAYMSVQMQVGNVLPQKTILGQNFPNPFNPETWIPYQLKQNTDVTLRIFDVSGRLIRTLDLGHKSTGLYVTISTAAYWDGKNDAGETVSSGIYFYTLQTENFSATRRMVILK